MVANDLSGTIDGDDKPGELAIEAEQEGPSSSWRKPWQTPLSLAKTEVDLSESIPQLFEEFEGVVDFVCVGIFIHSIAAFVVFHCGGLLRIEAR